MNNKRVVVTGLGAITPLGNDVASTWEGLISGKNGVAPITLLDASLFKTHFAAEVKGFTPTDYINPKDARKMDRFGHFSLCSAIQAVKDAQLDFSKEDSHRAGVIWASGMGGLSTFEEQYSEYEQSGRVPRFSPFFLPKMLISMGAGQISLYFGLRGISYAVTSACASSAHAIANAFNTIRLGQADIMITGGADADITASGLGSFNAIHALSTRNDAPSTASRPFSASRDGFVMGEGGACLVLEEYEHAVARGAKIYAELTGAGITSDAYHMTAPDPEAEGASRAMMDAIRDAGIQPQDIDYVNAHGTSTPLGDIAEIRAIKRTLGEHAYNVNISSTKSMTGHALGAAGAIEAVATILAIYHGIVPPTINHEEQDIDEQIDYNLNFTFNTAQKRDIRHAISNAFGFGGHNACLLFSKI